MPWLLHLKHFAPPSLQHRLPEHEATREGDHPLPLAARPVEGLQSPPEPSSRDTPHKNQGTVLLWLFEEQKVNLVIDQLHSVSIFHAVQVIYYDTDK